LRCNDLRRSFDGLQPNFTIYFYTKTSKTSTVSPGNVGGSESGFYHEDDCAIAEPSTLAATRRRLPPTRGASNRRGDDDHPVDGGAPNAPLIVWAVLARVDPIKSRNSQNLFTAGQSVAFYLLLVSWRNVARCTV
jgi:hypothetical protein